MDRADATETERPGPGGPETDTAVAGRTGSPRPGRTGLVTVTYNGAHDWDEFYRTLLAQDDEDWCLVVVDNASSDGTVDLLRGCTDPRVQVILNDTNVGVAAGNNQGIRAALDAGAEQVLLINNDTALPPDLLSSLHDCRERTGAAAVTPLIAFHEDPGHIWYGGGEFRRATGVANVHTGFRAPLSTVGTTPFETGYAPTTCLMVDRAVFEQVGLMDERYFVYWDDADFIWRIRSAGVRVVVDPRVVLLHKASSSTGGMSSDFSIRFMHRNQILFTRKFHGPLWAAYTALTIGIEGARRLVRGRELPRQSWVRARAVREGFRLGARRAPDERTTTCVS